MIFLSPIQIYFLKCIWILLNWILAISDVIDYSEEPEGLLGFNYSSKWKGAGLSFEAS